MPLLDFWRSVRNPPPRVAIVRLEGAIGAGGPRGLSLESVEAALERAFFLPRVRAVALLINSPGGAAVQSKLIHDRIRQLSEETGLPVFAFIEDMGASGGYMIALAGDEVFADSMSLVGSIGVIAGGFGFVGLLEKLGVERRVHSAGAHKAALDPFLPENPEGSARLKRVLESTHGAFIALVRARRAGLLKGSDEDLFNADFWSGAEAQALGLVDEIGSLYPVMRARFGKKTRFKRISAKKTGALSLFGLSIGAGAAEIVLSRIEHSGVRGLMSRF